MPRNELDYTDIDGEVPGKRWNVHWHHYHTYSWRVEGGYDVVVIAYQKAPCHEDLARGQIYSSMSEVMEIPK